MRSLFFAVLLLITNSVLLSFCQTVDEKTDKSIGDVTITILYDNYKFSQDLENDWGFACLIEGLEKTILFDAGGKGNILLSNMQKLGKDPADVDIVFFSHIHGDHTGGTQDFLNLSHDVTVYLPVSFPVNFKNMIKANGAEIVEVKGPQEILKSVMTTGETGTEIIEQSLIIQTENGSIIITGCAHPQILDIIGKSSDISGSNILLAMGGFHLLDYSDNEIQRIIEGFRSMHIKYAGPTHCSGDKTIKLFKENFGENFISLGAGKVLKINEL